MARTNQKTEDNTNNSVDIEKIKEDLNDYIIVQVKKEIEQTIDKDYKKEIKEKNRRIFFGNILLFIMLVAIIYLVFLLYKQNYFEKYLLSSDINNQNSSLTHEKEDNNEEVKDKVVSLKEKIEKYGYLLNKINISEKCDYLNDYYSGKLSNSLKNYIALNNVDLKSFTVEDDYNIISEEAVNNSYSSIFSDDFEKSNFDFNGNKIRYIGSLKSFISEYLITKNDNNITREIIDISLEDNKVIITTVEGIIKDDKLYNIMNNNEIEEYTLNEISNYKDKLNILKYIFEGNKLIDLEV